ncbi:MAG: ABC transporter ATP-binding protein [Actinomycetota bacterium]|nr:ABC transporter ATP-binding protein [Actinomycetota bacterium]
MPALQTVEVAVSFGGIRALDGVDLEAEMGQVTALIGPNGAGKTTLFNVITGLQNPNRGKVLLDGDDITSLAVHRRARRGLARTFQRLEIFGSLTVADNVRVAVELRRRWSRTRFDVDEAVRELLERTGISRVADQRAETLSTGVARLTELARALAASPRILLLDEPGSGLDSAESEAFGQLLRDLAADGLGVLMVEHDMELVMGVCDRIHVLDFGVKIAEGTPEEIRSNPRVQAAYLGADEEAAPAEDLSGLTVAAET